MLIGMSLSLPRTLAAWPGETFAETLQAELAEADPAALALERLLHHGSHVVAPPGFMILGSEADDTRLRVRLGVFLRSVLAGCACADDPTPLDTREEYGELLLLIDRRDARTEVRWP